VTRVAVIADIHGNLPALDAVLDEIQQAGVERIIVAGDVVPGPMPRECIDRLVGLAMPVQFVRGNGDRDALSRIRGEPTDPVPERYVAAMRWVAEELRSHEAVLATWPASLRVDIPRLGTALICHATPRNDTELFTRLTSEERLRPVFAGIDASVVICGHTHMQFDRTVGAVRVVNAGSIGMPFGEPGAYWTLLGPDVQLRRTMYDLQRAADHIRATAYPQAEEFASGNVLRPPTEQAMLDAFGRAELH
jgi:putative phosphoesterase